tara:strand:+ start:497 stop:670 length:174 start_codon:yes stop_codon:yes gene_type:complete
MDFEEVLCKSKSQGLFIGMKMGDSFYYKTTSVNNGGGCKFEMCDKPAFWAAIEDEEV